MTNEYSQIYFIAGLFHAMTTFRKISYIKIFYAIGFKNEAVLAKLNSDFLGVKKEADYTKNGSVMFMIIWSTIPHTKIYDDFHY